MPKIDTALRKTRTEFKQLLLDTTFIGKVIDNAKMKGRVPDSYASLGPVMSRRDFAGAASFARLHAVTSIYEGAAQWVFMQDQRKLSFSDLHHHRIGGFILSHDQMVELELGPFQQHTQSNITFDKSASNQGVVATAYLLGGRPVPVYSTGNHEHKESFVFYSRAMDDNGANLGQPFSLGWIWRDTYETLECGTCYVPNHQWFARGLEPFKYEKPVEKAVVDEVQEG